jgi:tryptophan synthase alpha chain
VREALEAQGLDLIPLVGLNTSRERMGLYARKARGFAYFVSVLGTTGERASLPSEVRQGLALAMPPSPPPRARGLGITPPPLWAHRRGLGAAAVFGSSLIKHLDAGGDAAGFMARWR